MAGLGPATTPVKRDCVSFECVCAVAVPPSWCRAYEGVGSVQDSPVPVTYGTDAEAAEALQTGAVVVDLSHWGRLRVHGEDRLNFLHNQVSMTPHKTANCFQHLL